MNNLGSDIEDICVDDLEKTVEPIPQIRIVPLFHCEHTL